jgi:hypothetical protein
MISVMIEVGGGSARFNVAVRAQNIRRAVSLAKARYSGGDIRVVFPIEPDAFFCKDPAVGAELIELEMPEKAAG